MFVRWKRRKMICFYGEYQKSAILVESYRNENGLPRQRYIKALGGIIEGREHMEGHQIGFWEKNDQALSELELSDDDREKIMNALLAVCERPDMEKVYALRAEMRAMTESIRGKL